MRCNGSTLLEAVVAVTILSVTMISVLGIVAQHVDGAARVRSRVTAAHLAEQRIEAVRALDAEALHASVGDAPTRTFPGPFTAYRWRTSVRRAHDDPSLVLVQVLVEWPAGDLRLSSLLYRPPASP